MALFLADMYCNIFYCKLSLCLLANFTKCNLAFFCETVDFEHYTQFSPNSLPVCPSHNMQDNLNLSQHLMKPFFQSVDYTFSKVSTHLADLMIRMRCARRKTVHTNLLIKFQLHVNTSVLLHKMCLLIKEKNEAKRKFILSQNSNSKHLLHSMHLISDVYNSNNATSIKTHSN